MAIKNSILEFCRFSSIRGLSRAARASTGVLRMLWITVVLTGGTIATWHVTRYLLAYYNYESVTSTNINPRQTEFPDVTVCSLQPFSSRVSHEKLRELEREHSRLVIEVTNEDPRTANWMGSAMNGYFTNIRAFLQSFPKEDTITLVRPFEDFVVSCRWDGWGSYGLFSESCSVDNFNYIYYLEYGLCFIIKLNSTGSTWYNVNTIRNLKLILHTDTGFNYSFTNMTVMTGGEPMDGVAAYIHERNTLPDFSRPLRFAPGFSAVIDLERFTHKLLPEPYGNCSTDDFIYLSDGINTTYKYTYEACVGFCVNELLTKSCGCFIPDYPWIDEWVITYKLCANLSYLAGDPTGLTLIKRLNCVESVLVVPHSCGCVEPCRSTIHYPTIHQAAWPHLSYQLQFYHKVIKQLPEGIKAKFDIYENISLLMETDPTAATRLLENEDLIKRNFVELTIQLSSRMVTEIEEVPAMSLLGVIGSIGGLLNLWIGVSFVTMFEILELVCHLGNYFIFGTGKKEPVKDIRGNVTIRGNVKVSSLT